MVLIEGWILVTTSKVIACCIELFVLSQWRRPLLGRNNSSSGQDPSLRLYNLSELGDIPDKTHKISARSRGRASLVRWGFSGMSISQDIKLLLAGVWKVKFQRRCTCVRGNRHNEWRCGRCRGPRALKV